MTRAGSDMTQVDGYGLIVAERQIDEVLANAG